MRYSDTHCDYLCNYKTKKDQSSIKLYKKSDILIQVFAIFFHPDDKMGILGGLKQLLRFKTMTLNKKLFFKNINEINQVGWKKRIFPILALEGLKPTGYSLKVLNYYIKQGVKIVSLAWNEKNKFAGGALSDGKITKDGEKALDLMYDNNIVLDVSHLNEKSFYQALEYFKGKVIASHSCCKTLVDSQRNLTDKQIKCIIDRDGFIGINFFPDLLVGKNNDATSLDIVSHIDHICTLGGKNNVGLGSDFSGIYRTPTDMQDCTKFNAIYENLKANGFNKTSIEKICYKNFYNFYLK